MTSDGPIDVTAEAAVRLTVHLLVEKRYSDLEALTRCTRLTASEMESAVAAYGRTLVFPPDETFRSLDAREIEAHPQNKKWSIVLPLWTKEEGQSDLALELTLEREVDGTRIELDNIHVL